MSEIPIDIDESEAREDGMGREDEQGKRIEVEIERERTKRQLIEAVRSIAVVVLYMAFTLLRDREPGAVPLEDEPGPEDDWSET